MDYINIRQRKSRIWSFRMWLASKIIGETMFMKNVCVAGNLFGYSQDVCMIDVDMYCHDGNALHVNGKWDRDEANWITENAHLMNINMKKAWEDKTPLTSPP